tara:strand:- start:914 stop:1948 length:1035 start_codon:yes stop_codon:yes gene_type:complete
VNFLNNKTVMVTGCCGTVGFELVRQLLDDNNYNLKFLIGIDNNEAGLFFQDQAHSQTSNASFFICDIRNSSSLSELVHGVDIIFHCAALKHVVLCEKSPEQAVETNIRGVQNVIMAAKNSNVEKVIFTSSDKAVNPTNVMGTSKLMGERLITAGNSHSGTRPTIFASTRFGNVLGSSGSVVPLFKEQIKNGGPITLTDNDMSRFVMNVKEAARLVLETSEMAKGGEVFITKMPVMNIKDLAEVLIEELAPVYGFNTENIEIKIIGSKPGEKLYEELMSQEETSRYVETTKYFAVLPAFRNVYSEISYEYEDAIAGTLNNCYISYDQPAMPKKKIKQLLKECQLL